MFFLFFQPTVTVEVKTETPTKAKTQAISILNPYPNINRIKSEQNPNTKQTAIIHRPLQFLLVCLCFPTLPLFLQATAEGVKQEGTPKEKEGIVSICLSAYLPCNPNKN